MGKNDKQPKRTLGTATQVLLILAGCFFLSMVMTTGINQIVIPGLCLAGIVGYGIYQIKQKKETKDGK